jgi:hypothetical protein
MTTVTSDDIRVLARSGLPDPVLVLLNDELRVVGAAMIADTPAARIVYTRNRLVHEFGEEITDVEAEVLAAGLTNEITPPKAGPGA